MGRLPRLKDLREPLALRQAGWPRRTVPAWRRSVIQPASTKHRGRPPSGPWQVKILSNQAAPAVAAQDRLSLVCSSESLGIWRIGFPHLHSFSGGGVMSNSFDAKATLSVGSRTYTYYNLKALEPIYSIARLPYAIKVLLENLLRHEDGQSTTPLQLRQEPQVTSDFRLRSQGPCRLGTGESGLVLG